MNNPPIEPIIKNGGSAFQDNNVNNSHPVARLKTSNKVKVVSLTEWCDKNFVTKRVGRKLIKLKYLIAFRLKHQWWVTANPECLPELLQYLQLEKLLFDVVQD